MSFLLLEDGARITLEGGSGSLLIASVIYNIYANNGAGGPVDFSAPVYTTAGTSWSPSAITRAGSYTWHIRAQNEDDGLEEHNADARVTVVIDDSLMDITAKPVAPTAVLANPLKGGGARIIWQYVTPSGRTKPSEFRVYGGTPLASFDAPLATVSYVGDGRYYHDLSGLTDGAIYQFVVRASNATAEDGNTTTVSVTVAASGPRPPQGLICL